MGRLLTKRIHPMAPLMTRYRTQQTQTLRMTEVKPLQPMVKMMMVRPRLPMMRQAQVTAAPQTTSQQVPEEMMAKPQIQLLTPRPIQSPTPRPMMTQMSTHKSRRASKLASQRAALSARVSLLIRKMHASTCATISVPPQSLS